MLKQKLTHTVEGDLVMKPQIILATAMAVTKGVAMGLLCLSTRVRSSRSR